MYDFSVALISALTLLKYSNFEINNSGIKTDWGSPYICSYLRNVYYVITFCCFTHVFVDSAAYKQLTMKLSQARNLLRRNNLSGNLKVDDFVNDFVFLWINLLIVQYVLVRVIDCLHMCIHSKSKITTSVFSCQNRLITEPIQDKGGQFAADLFIVFIYFLFQHQLLKEAGETAH